MRGLLQPLRGVVALCVITHRPIVAIDLLYVLAVCPGSRRLRASRANRGRRTLRLSACLAVLGQPQDAWRLPAGTRRRPSWGTRGGSRWPTLRLNRSRPYQAPREDRGLTLGLS